MSIGFLTLDIIIILIILLGTFIYSFNAGKKQVVKILLSVYPALLIFLNLPTGLISGKDEITKIGMFLGIFIAVYFLLKRNFTSATEHSGGRRFLDSLLISLASVFTLLVIYYHVLPIESLYELKLPFSGFMVQKFPFYITILIPLVFIVLTNRRDD